MSRKSRSPPPHQCRGPVNLVNEEWAPGQMTHELYKYSRAGSARPLLPVDEQSRINRDSYRFWWRKVTPLDPKGDSVLQRLYLLQLIGRENKGRVQIFTQTETTQFTYQRPE